MQQNTVCHLSVGHATVLHSMPLLSCTLLCCTALYSTLTLCHSTVPHSDNLLHNTKFNSMQLWQSPLWLSSIRHSTTLSSTLWLFSMALNNPRPSILWHDTPIHYASPLCVPPLHASTFYFTLCLYILQHCAPLSDAALHSNVRSTLTHQDMDLVCVMLQTIKEPYKFNEKTKVKA